jgi:hypothetical protein
MVLDKLSLIFKYLVVVFGTLLIISTFKLIEGPMGFIKGLA